MTRHFVTSPATTLFRESPRIEQDLGSVCAATTCKLRGKPCTGLPSTVTRSEYVPARCKELVNNHSPASFVDKLNTVFDTPTASTRNRWSLNTASLLNLSRAKTATAICRPARPRSMPPPRSRMPLSCTLERDASAKAGEREMESGAPSMQSRCIPPHHCRCTSAVNTRNEYLPVSVARNLARAPTPEGSSITSASTTPGPSPSANNTKSTPASPLLGGATSLPNRSRQNTLTNRTSPAFHSTLSGSGSTAHIFGSSVDDLHVIRTVRVWPAPVMMASYSPALLAE
mmetsp:Transcript_7021/g.25623  ORF Transcript_7021/g.25623 Transcript_7021/m.25623 type:complete len:286 (-) Transcript_7021:12876-13733(-)